MAQLTSSHYFLSLATLAIFLLWGISLWNGTVRALFRASWQGAFEDGTPFQTNYTGIFIIDFPISLLVAFFFFGTNGHNRLYQYFLVDAYSTLQSAFVWLYIESGRSCPKPFSVENPIVWGLLWQGFGAAISLPLYFYHHLRWVDKQPSLPSPPSPVVQATPLSFLLGALLPAVVGMLPTWIERSPNRHQLILALWQPGPLWVCLFQASAIAVLSRLKPGRSARHNLFWAQISYAIAAASSALGHLYVVTKIFSTSSPRTTFSTMFIPETLLGSQEGVKLLVGPRLFLQYDLIIISLSSLSWIYVLVSRLLPQEKMTRFRVLGWLGLGLVVLGPGATVSLGLFWREGELERRRLLIAQGAKFKAAAKER